MAINIDPNILAKDTLAEKALTHETELERAKHERGWLGKIWGSKDCIPYNVAASIAILSILTGIVFTIVTVNIPTEKINVSIKDFWSIMTPLITLTIGYLFGKEQKKR